MCQFKSLLVLIICSFILLNTSYTQVTKEEAINIIMSEVVGGESLKYNVYINKELCSEEKFNTTPYDQIINPYDKSWLFFIDLMPEYGWGHPCQYVFIQESTGNYSTVNKTMPPLYYWLNWEEVSVRFPHQKVVQSTDTTVQSSPLITPDPHKYAMLITCNAWDDTARWNNLSHVYTGLKESYGFMDENIFVLSGDGHFDPNTMNLDLNGDDYDCDFDGPCTKEKITEIFEYLDTVMTEEDIFLFYATTHGDVTESNGQDTTSLRLYLSQPLFDYELAEMVDELTCSEMIFSMDICNGGGMIDDLAGPHRVIQVPVPWGSLIWRGWPYFDFFTYGWATAVRGYHPGSLTEPWEKGDTIGKHPNLSLVYPTWNMPDTMPDLVSFNGNGDGFIQFGEVFNYTKYLDYEADSLGIEYQNHGFQGDLLTLNGIEGRVDTTQSITGSYLFGRKLTLSPGVTLSKGVTALNFYLNDSTEILVQDSAKLDINGNVTDIIGCAGESFVTVEGDLRQTRMDFTANPGSIINVRFTNTENDYELDHFAFNNAKVSGNCHSLSFEQSDFTNTTLKFSNGDLLITNQNKFKNSTVDISNPSSLASSCSINGNSFENTSENLSPALITIEDYTKFLIENNTIKYRNNRGIELFYAGWDEPGEHAIRNNDTIRYTPSSSPQVSELGIHSYFSNVTIEDNYISNNYYGITGFHGSELKVLGDSTAKDIHSTQLFENNTQSQCLFSYGSFPTKFQYNVLQDGLSTNHPFIRAVDYDEVIPATNHTRGMDTIHFHVENNYWVNDTNPSDRLLPLNKYYWRPIWWCPGARNLKFEDIPGELYAQAKELIDGEYYFEAESIFKQIIAEYPDSPYAQASLKGLFSLNPALHSTDYTYVKSYCDSLSMNPGDSLLGKTAEWLSIHCNIKDKHYQQAVNSLDSIIFNPGTQADSVFAMIDLCKVFSLMNDSIGSKSTLLTKHPDIIPSSQGEFIGQRKEWIDLLLKPLDNQIENIDMPDYQTNEDNTVKILALYPNPTDGDFTIRYVSTFQGTACIHVLSITGQTLTDKNFEINSPGEYQQVVNDKDIPAGIYFVFLSVNGLKTDAEKLLVVR